MIQKILIANRGEIAVRIIRACRELGTKAVAVFSDADKKSLHTLLADESYNIGPGPSSESYLDIRKLIQTAKESGCDAIHPGYGFLSERAEFIKAVEDSGLIFIGPSSKSVSMMGSKTAARDLMSRNNVPIVPGTLKPISNLSEGKEIALSIGFPVLIKASAGGGGKGMKKVFNLGEFDSAFESAKREALKSFGDDAVYIEKLIEKPKHIEVQILADKHGNYYHIFERECSVQRRHQKIVEEAPSASLDEKLREKITAAAVNAAKACGYYSAGTIEFLLDTNRNFYFLEMNTRIQVEHPVTEQISGLDLIKMQIKIANGEVLALHKDNYCMRGHAVEARIYAEEPTNNFAPSTGRLTHHKIPSGPGIRVDEGFTVGSEISMFYDPMIAKVTAYGSDRHTAIKRLTGALREYQVAGVSTNIPFLIWILEHKSFNDASYDINFIDEEIEKGTVRGIIAGEDVTRTAAAFVAIMRHTGTQLRENVAENGSGARTGWVEMQYE